MFFWELFRFRNERNIIPFILLPIAELTEWKECGLLGIDRIRVLLDIFGGKSYAATRAGRVRRYSSSQVTSDSVSRSETCRSVLFQIEILCMLLFLNQNKNSQNSPKRMHPKLSLVFRYSPKVSFVFIEKEVFLFRCGFPSTCTGENNPRKRSLE